MGNELTTRPNFLAQAGAEGVEDVGRFFQPPRLKIIQKQADDLLLEKHDVGDIIVVPQQVEVARRGEEFSFTPLFFFVEWCQLAPIEMRGTMPMVLERSTNMKSKIAQLAMNPDTWVTKRDDGVTVKNTEFLNFIVVLHNHELSDLPMVMSFRSGSHKHGRNLCGLIKLRRDAAIYGCVFSAKTSQESNQQGSWYSIVPTNPESHPWVEDEAQFLHYQKLHREFKNLHEDSKIVVDYETDTEEDPNTEF